MRPGEIIVLLISGAAAQIHPSAARGGPNNNNNSRALEFSACMCNAKCTTSFSWCMGRGGRAAPAASRTNSALVACYFAICTRAWASAARSARRRWLQVLSKYNSRQSLCRGACVSNFSELLLCVRVSGSECVFAIAPRVLCFKQQRQERERRAERCAHNHLPISCAGWRPHIHTHTHAKLFVSTATCHCVCGGLKISSATRSKIARFYAWF